MNEKVLKLMEGAYDTHMHAQPALLKCNFTILEVAEAARKLGMKGFVYKDLQFSTAPQAKILMEAVPGIDVIGGVALNGTLGGLNPWAVEATLKMGGKVVWLFTIDSEYTVKQAMNPKYPYSKEHYRNLLVDMDAGGYSVFQKGTEELREETREIISIIKQYDGVVETSHLSPKEAYAVIKEGHDQGLKKMVATHCNQWCTPYTMAEQKAMLELGATISYCYETYLAKLGMDAEPIGNLTKLIREIGVDNIVLGTDMGQEFWPWGIDGMQMMISDLLDEGFTEDEIKRLTGSNPDRIYGLK